MASAYSVVAATASIFSAARSYGLSTDYEPHRNDFASATPDAMSAAELASVSIDPACGARATVAHRA